MEPQSYYPGIQVMRPDVLHWYAKQGSERPIYMTKRYPSILASRAYPIDQMTATFGPGFFQCQLDYMGALALHEGFNQWILYGIGYPYVKERESDRAHHWYKHHATFLHWLRIAKARGVEILYSSPDSNMITDEMIADEERYPAPKPNPLRYGYDMGVEHAIAAGIEEYPFGSALG